MKKSILLILCIVSLPFFGSWQDRAMKKINKKVNHINKKAILSKKSTLENSSLTLYLDKKRNLLHITENSEKRVINYYYDAYTGDLIYSQTDNTSIYYQSNGFFAVLSQDNFSKEIGEKLALELEKKGEYIYKKLTQ